MKIFKQCLVAVAATIFISPPAFGQKTDDPGNEAGQKGGQHSEQGKENSNAQ